jgi:hypothetical protein
VSTSSIFVMILAFPPRGIVSCLPQARHFTIVLAQPKMICEDEHSVQDILRKRDLGEGNTSLSFMMVYTSSNFFRRWAALYDLQPHSLHAMRGMLRLLTLAFLWKMGFGWEP